MHTALSILLSISLMGLCLFFLGWLSAWYWKRRLPREHQPDESHTITTKDGWKLPLFRWSPNPKSTAHAIPIILCHGLGVNYLNIDLASDLSLARYLSAQGFDCWVASLRSGEDPTIKPPAGSSRQDFSMDMLVDHDVAAIVHYVLTQTKAPQAHWIGHSMGGLVLMLSDLTSQFSEPPIRSLSAIASPSLFQRKDFPEYTLDFLLRWLPTIPTSWILQPFAPISHWFGWAAKRMVRMEHCDPKVIQKVCLYMFADLSPRLLYQFSQMVRKEKLCREDGDLIYEQRLQDKTFPALFLVGASDGITPPHSARYAYEQWTGPKRWQLLTPENGTLPYGHGDILIGKQAPHEVYPIVLEWLVSVDSL